MMIGVFEVRYITQKLPAPRLTWFYNAYNEFEFSQVLLDMQDSLEESQRNFLSLSKNQMDYWLIHEEYAYIKKRSIANVLF